MATIAQEEMAEAIMEMLGPDGTLDPDNVPRGTFIPEDEYNQMRASGRRTSESRRRNIERSARLRDRLRRATERGDRNVRRAARYRAGKLPGGASNLATAGKWSTKLLKGAGWLGVGLLLYDLLKSGQAAADQGASQKRLGRAGLQGEMMASMMAGQEPTARDRLMISNLLRDQAQMGTGQDMKMSRDLRTILANDPNALKQAFANRQQVNPSMREAYARMGMVG